MAIGITIGLPLEYFDINFSNVFRLIRAIVITVRHYVHFVRLGRTGMIPTNEHGSDPGRGLRLLLVPY